ncbi:hypothetical protein [Hyphomonas sp. CACIAM 19H1]|uniref:hypothetical protein n=1 Tax=Hyphomonas sp. CACIAM 19H1 TaxID=1873716 RepID=UPI0013B064C1|nr:hypothetical protein [Hyphomonas sp. CACIAM 19H1]
MRADFAPWATSLIRFAQIAAEMLAVALVPRLGLGRFGFTVFLPRPVHEAIAAELTFIEAMARRALFLIAAARGALPREVSPSKARPASSGRALPDAPARISAPLFCLTEPDARRRIGKKVPPPTPNPGDAAPPLTEDTLLPTARLVRRLRALETVFLDPEANILRMRRLLAPGPEAILSRRGFEAARAASDNAVNFRLLGQVQGLVEGALLQMRRDTG